MFRADTVSGTFAQANISRAKPNLVEHAKSAIDQYKNVIDRAYAEADPILNEALAATYAAVLDLQKHPALLEVFLNDKRSGPVSKNPIQPIVRKLWDKVQSRETRHRYAACLAWAQREKVKPEDFVAWVKANTIKQAASNWAKNKRLPDEQTKLARKQMSRRDQLLAKLKAVPLPDATAKAFKPGIHLSAIRITAEGKGELFVFDIDPCSVDAFVLRNAR